MNYNFTYLKPKSIENVFKDKTNEDIQRMFTSASTQKYCIIELLRRNASFTIEMLRYRWPMTIDLIMKEIAEETE